MGACLSTSVDKQTKQVESKAPAAHTIKNPSPDEAYNHSTSSSSPEHVVKIAISGKNLAVAETSGYQPPDPYAVLCLADSRGTWIEASRTETLENNRDPNFDKALFCTFQFEKPQQLKVAVYSRNKLNTGDSAKDSMLGEAELMLRELVTARGNRLQLPLQNGALDACITLNVLDSSALNSELMCCLELEGVPVANPASARLFVRALREGEPPQPVMQTEARPAGGALTWQVQTPVRALCAGDFRAPLRLEVWEAAGGGVNARVALAGAASTNLRALQEQPRLALSAHGKEAGYLCVRGATVRRTLSFLDYMAGGCEINFMCALDFSGGNPLAEDPASAHHTGPDGQAPSVYERALAALGAVMQFYDPLRSFPLWGFGGQAKPCWALNGQQFQPEVKGLRGLLRTYRKALIKSRIGGPALLAPVVQAARDLVEQLSLVQHRYFLLVVLTSSVGDDLDAFREALRHASADLALSIVVIGIGGADFRPLQEAVEAASVPMARPATNGAQQLGGKTGVLSGRRMAQFARIIDGDYNGVAARVLSQVPEQFMDYFGKRGIIPKTFSSDLAAEITARGNEQ